MNVIDLFCGAGGFSCGLEQAGYTILAGIDINDDALATFRANHDAPGLNIDLSEASPEDILNEIGITADDVDVVAGGPPCQAFSMAGNRDPDDPRAKLVNNYYEFVEYCQPQAFVMENVKGILSMDDGAVIDDIQTRCDDLGYNIAIQTMNAADYGVPQTRERVIIIGMKHHQPVHPDPTCVEFPTVSDILGSDAYDEDGLPYWTTSPSGDSYQVSGRDPFRTTEEPSFTHTGRYVRLIPQSFEPHEDATPAEAQYRRLTQEEMALLQSFPASYEWRGDGVMRQQGNAVPPLMARAIGEQVMETLTEEERDLAGQTTLLDHGFAPADD
jgi:DNA (cytosine-5)-methyltransferase 1